MSGSAHREHEPGAVVGGLDVAYVACAPRDDAGDIDFGRGRRRAIAHEQVRTGREIELPAHVPVRRVHHGQGPDPVVLDFPIAYVKRPVPVMDAPDGDVRLAARFRARCGPVRARDCASPTAAEVNVTGVITGGAGDVRDVRALLRRHPARVRDARAAHRGRRRGRPADLEPVGIRSHDAAAASRHPVGHRRRGRPRRSAPHYLPDGRIVFSSTRQRQSRAILLDEGKPQFAAQDEDRREDASARRRSECRTGIDRNVSRVAPCRRQQGRSQPATGSETNGVARNDCRIDLADRRPCRRP